MQRAHSVQTEMCLLLNITEERYNEIMYRNGLAYLQWYLPCNARQRRVLEGSKIYWSWFRLQWEMHEDALIDSEYFFHLTIDSRRKLFQHLHDPQALAVEVKPNDIVLAELNKKEVVYDSF